MNICMKCSREYTHKCCFSRTERTVGKIVEALGKPKYMHYVVRADKDTVRVIRHDGVGEPQSFSYNIAGERGLISMSDAKAIARIASGTRDPDPKALAVLTEYLEEEWAHLRADDAKRAAAAEDMVSGVQGAAVATARGGASGGGGGYAEESGTAEEDMGIWNPTGEDAEAIREATEGKWCLSVQSQPHIFWNGSSSDQKAPLFSTAFLVQGEASWPNCIDKDGSVSGDLLDTLYEFYERLREKDSTYPKIVRKDFVAKYMGMFMHIEHGPFTIDRIPWGKSTKASTLSAIEFAMDRAIKENAPERAGHLAVMLSIFQDMFAPKDDSALWGSSCD